MCRLDQRSKGKDSQRERTDAHQDCEDNYKENSCGEGSRTWDHLSDEEPQRLTGMHSPSAIVNKMTSISIEPGVEVEVTMADV